MSSLSAQIIALNSKTNGKDKIYRTIQYFSKFAWYVLWKSKSNKEFIEVLKKLEAAMSNTRKVLRLGRSHEMLESALKTIHLQDHFLRIVLTTSSLSQACYLVMDNLLWLNSIGLVQLSSKRTQDYSKWSNKFWLYSSILYLARDLHEYLELLKTGEDNDQLVWSSDPTRKYQRDDTSGVYSSQGNTDRRRLRKRLIRKVTLVLLARKNLPLHLDTVKNLFDVVLPLASLDFIKVSPGVQGLCGLVSSILSLFIVWDSRFKLTP